MILGPPAPPAELAFAEQLRDLLGSDGPTVDIPAVDAPAAVLALDTVAREAVADLDAALQECSYTDAAAALDRLDMARRQMRDVFDQGVPSGPLVPILNVSSKWARIADAYRTALKTQRGH